MERGEKEVGRGKRGVWNSEIHPTISKIDKQKGYIVYHREM